MKFIAFVFLMLLTTVSYNPKKESVVVYSVQKKIEIAKRQIKHYNDSIAMLSEIMQRKIDTVISQNMALQQIAAKTQKRSYQYSVAGKEYSIVYRRKQGHWKLISVNKNPL